LHTFANPFISIVPQEELDSTLLYWKDIPIGAGPYRVTSEGFNNGTLFLEKVSPSSEGVQQVALYTKDIRAHYDISLISAKDVKNAQTDWSDFPHSVTSFSFSRLNALGRNVHFKKAVSLLVDRKALSEGIPGSSPMNQLLPRVAWGTSGLPDAHNKEAARKENWPYPKRTHQSKLELCDVYGCASIDGSRIYGA
jgi:hypothetical protein